MRLFLLVFLLVAPGMLRAQSGDCALGEAEADLFVNDVRARLFNNGGLFWKGRGNVYNVPAAPAGQLIRPNAIFAAGIWMGGKVNGQIRTAAADYGNWEMWPGPLDASGDPPTDCASYDRIFRITRADVHQYEQAGVVSTALRDWPWQWGAPVIDGDGDPDNYDLAGGDRPEVLGHETHWWVMNDAASTHATTGTDPINMEVRVSAFAVNSTLKALHQTTFYRYRLTYRGTEPFTDAYFGFWSDVDLGNATDDYIGSDTTLDMGFAYNADDFDEGSDGYGAAPPALGTVFLEGLNEAHPDRRMSAFLHEVCLWQECDIRYRVPWYHNVLHGVWGDGRPIIACGDGFGQSGLACEADAKPTSYLYPGDPVTRAFWSELNMDGAGHANPPNDRRYLMSTGPFTMQPGETKDVVLAIVYARGENHLDSVTKLRSAVRGVRAYWQADPALRNAPLPPAPQEAPILPAAYVAPDPAHRLTFTWWRPVEHHRYEVEAHVANFDTLIVTMGGEAMLDLSRHLSEGQLLPGSVVTWRVRATTLGGAGPWSAWQDVMLGQPDAVPDEDRFRIVRAGPQPVRNRLAVRYAVGPARRVRLALYDPLGRRVYVLDEGAMEPGGYYDAEADVSGLAPGLYLLRLEAEGPALQTDAQPVVVVR